MDDVAVVQRACGRIGRFVVSYAPPQARVEIAQPHASVRDRREVRTPEPHAAEDEFMPMAMRNQAHIA